VLARAGLPWETHQDVAPNVDDCDRHEEGRRSESAHHRRRRCRGGSRWGSRLCVPRRTGGLSLAWSDAKRRALRMGVTVASDGGRAAALLAAEHGKAHQRAVAIRLARGWRNAARDPLRGRGWRLHDAGRLPGQGETTTSIEVWAWSTTDRSREACAAMLARGRAIVGLPAPLGSRTLLHAPTDPQWSSPNLLASW